MSLGYALYQPEERMITPYSKLIDEMCVSLAGRAAEEIVFNQISTGALDDLQKVTQKAYAMVSYYGMDPLVGNVSFYDPNSDMSLTKPYSDQTAKLIDDEVRKLIDSAYQRVKQLLIEKRTQLEIIAKSLLEKEVLLQSDVEKLIGPRPFGNTSTVA
jgi:cell division protease FtsH